MENRDKVNQMNKLIEKYKNRLIECTTIEHIGEEGMKKLDNILFRFWQMGWLDILENHEKEKRKAEIMKNIKQLERLKERCLLIYEPTMKNDCENEYWKRNIDSLKYAIDKLKEDYSKLESEVEE